MTSPEQTLWEGKASFPCSSISLLFATSSAASHPLYPFPRGRHFSLRRKTSPRVGNKPPCPSPGLQQCGNARAEVGTGVCLSGEQRWRWQTHPMMAPAPSADPMDLGGFVLPPRRVRGTEQHQSTTPTSKGGFLQL